MRYVDFEAKALANGWEARECTVYHWQMKRGRISVNYYPTRQTLYIDGQVHGIRCETIDKIFRHLNGEEFAGLEKIKRLGTSQRRKVKKHLYFVQGVNSCFVCNRHMTFEQATLEHRVPIALGGSNRMDNFTLSHERCNQKRGHELVPQKGVVA